MYSLFHMHGLETSNEFNVFKASFLVVQVCTLGNIFTPPVLNLKLLAATFSILDISSKLHIQFLCFCA
jgi:hypothetical protein